MARQPFFSGNYGSALGQVDTRPIMQGAAAQAAMYQGLGQNIGGAIEKYQLNKQKADTADMMIGAYLQNMPEDKQLELQNSDTDLGKSLKKLSEGELTTSKKIALAGALGVMQTQAKTAADIAESEARASYYRQPRHAPPSPEKVAEAGAIKTAMNLLTQQGGGRRRGAQAPPGAPGLPGPGAAIASQAPSLGGAPPALPPRTGAVSQAMNVPPPPRTNPKKYDRVSGKEKQLLKFGDQHPIAAAVLDKSVLDGGIGKLRDRTREWGRNEIGRAQEVLDKGGLPTGLYLIPTSKDTQLVQSKPEAKPDLYEVQDIADGSRQQYMGNNKWVELVVDEFDTRELAEEKARPLGGKVTYNDKTGGFNVEMPSGFASQMEKITEPAFKAPVFYHRASNKFFTKDAKGKMGEMVDAVTVVGQDKSGDDIVVLNGGSTPYVQNAQGLTQILPEKMRPEAHMQLLSSRMRGLSANPVLTDYMMAKRRATQDGEKGWGDDTGIETTDAGVKKYWYKTEGDDYHFIEHDAGMEELIKELEEVGADMTKLRLLHPLPTP
jgi:hypothetical protein